MGETTNLSLCFRVLMNLDRAPGFVGGVANIFQRAIDTLRLACDAEFASMPDDLMGKENPFLAGDDAHQILLDFLRIIVGRQFQAARNAMHVSVDDYAFGNFEPGAEYHVRGFARDAGQGEQVLHLERNLAAEVGDYFLGRSYY